MAVRVTQLSSGRRYSHFGPYLFPNNADLEDKFLCLGFTQINVNIPLAGRILFTNIAAGATNMLLFVPNAIIDVKNKSQFSQIVYAADNGIVGATTRPQISVLATGYSAGFNNFLTCYSAVIVREGARVDIIRNSGFFPAATSATLGTRAMPNIGDTIRLEGILEAGQTRLRWLVNGVQIGADMVDAGGLTLGFPGFGSRVDGLGATSFGFETFECGLV